TCVTSSASSRRGGSPADQGPFQVTTFTTGYSMDTLRKEAGGRAWLPLPRHSGRRRPACHFGHVRPPPPPRPPAGHPRGGADGARRAGRGAVAPVERRTWIDNHVSRVCRRHDIRNPDAAVSVPATRTERARIHFPGTGTISPPRGCWGL